MVEEVARRPASACHATLYVPDIVFKRPSIYGFAFRKHVKSWPLPGRVDPPPYLPAQHLRESIASCPLLYTEKGGFMMYLSSVQVVREF